MTEHLSGGDMLIRALQDEGVDYIFGYPGGAALHIYDAIFRQQRIEHILVRHEQAATHMADGYARATGRPGVVLVTSGPGATNAITGIATAYMDSIPLVVISGQVATHLIGTDAFQETDMVGVSRPVVKHSFLVKSAAEIPLIVKKAFYIATSGRPGPVVIDVPKDTTDPAVTAPYKYPKSVSLRSYNPATRGHTGQIRRAVEALARAMRQDCLESIRSLKNVPEMFTSLEAQSAWPEGFKLFRPVRLIACALLYKLGGHPEPQAWLFHLANVLGHGIASMLLFAVSSRLLAKWFPDANEARVRTFALWAAVAYAGHPVASEVVCWAKALDDELATIFTLASTLCLLRWTNHKQPVTGALLLFVLAIYSKISAVPFALVAMLLVRQVHGLSWITAARKTSGFFIAALLFMIHRHNVIGQSSQTSPISGTYAQTLLDMLPVVPQYVKLLWGIPPFYIDYTFQKGGHAVLSPPVLTGIGLLLAGFALVVWSWRSEKWRFIGFGFVWTGLFLLPVSNLLPMMHDDVPKSERAAPRHCREYELFPLRPLR